MQPALSPTLNDFLLFPQNELDDVPFFDVRLPYELAINIFQYLNRRELGLCAQVSSCSPWPAQVSSFESAREPPEQWICRNHTADRADRSKYGASLKEGRRCQELQAPFHIPT